MKRLLLLLTAFTALQANAQPYSISFSGTGLSTVKVQNLTSGVVVDVPAGDVLLLSTPTGIPEVNKLKTSGLKVYPNPMTDKSTFEILPPLAGDAIISVCDMSGKVLTQIKCYLENYKQEFNLSGIKNGLHVINVQGNGYQFSEKLLSTGKSNGTAIIARLSNNFQASVEKKTIILDTKGVQAIVNMAYTAGERLKFTAVSGNNSTVMTDIPTANKTVTFTFTECKDGDNYYYPVVQIGTQVWMAENLKTTKYSTGVLIGTTSPYNKDIIGETNPRYQWAYNGNETNVAVYGRLYTWFAVTYAGKVCPTGWHSPTYDEWTTLENFLIANGYNYDGTNTGNKIAKALTSIDLWTSSATEGAVGNHDYIAKRNASGFTALPGGVRFNNGTYQSIGLSGNWWTSTSYSALEGFAWYRALGCNLNYVYIDYYYKGNGYSVRCVKD
jgi:uncharacterized protein (TIGR02145 family)